MMNNDYIGCEIAARLTGHLENVILRHMTEGNYQEAKRHITVLIDCYSSGGWGPHTERWLESYKVQRDTINDILYEAARAKSNP